MRSRPPSLLPLLGLAAALAAGACGRRPIPGAPPAPSPTVRVDLVALAREHPLFPQLARLQQLADRVEAGRLPPSQADSLAAGLQLPAAVAPAPTEKAEAKSPPQGSKERVPGGAAPGEARGGTSVLPADVEAELTAIREQAAVAAREWAESTSPDAEPPAAEPPDRAPRGDPLARARAAADLRAAARRLAAIIREETASACRRVAAQQDLRLAQGDLAARDATADFRERLRRHWQP